MAEGERSARVLSLEASATDAVAKASCNRDRSSFVEPASHHEAGVRTRSKETAMLLKIIPPDKCSGRERLEVGSFAI
jgi:hypothetical protein